MECQEARGRCGEVRPACAVAAAWRVRCSHCGVWCACGVQAGRVAVWRACCGVWRCVSGVACGGGGGHTVGAPPIHIPALAWWRGGRSGEVWAWYGAVSAMVPVWCWVCRSASGVACGDTVWCVEGPGGESARRRNTAWPPPALGGGGDAACFCR